MTNSLKARNLLASTQPYNVPGISYAGTETLPSSNVSPNITDWVLVEVRDSTTANGGLGNLLTVKAVMLSDGTIKDASSATAGDLTSNITLSDLLVNTNYKVILRHRNHLAIATNSVVNFNSSGQANLDFTNNYKIKGANQQVVGVVGGGTYNSTAAVGTTGSYFYGLRATDGSRDGQIDAVDRNLINTSDEFDGTYDNKDLNLDGGIDASDRNLSQTTEEARVNL
jgi:hypothetical protein